MADALDSKSSNRKIVWVQVPPPVLLNPRASFPPQLGYGTSLLFRLGTTTGGLGGPFCRVQSFSSNQSVLLQCVPICDARLGLRFMFEPHAHSVAAMLAERVDPAGEVAASAAVGLTRCTG